MQLPIMTVPVFASIDFRVTDEWGGAVEGAQVRGSGNHGGRFSLTTDYAGRCRAEFLPAGRYRIHGRHDEVGTGFEVVLLERGQEAEAEMILKP